MIRKSMFSLLVVVIFTVGCSNNEDNILEVENTGEQEIIAEYERQQSEKEQEAQADLTMGDVGTFYSSTGTYEITVESAQLVGKELDGIESTRSELLVLELTLENIGEEILSIDEVMETKEVASNFDGSGSPDGSEAFTSISRLTGSLEPGKQITGQFIGSVATSDVYYFREHEDNIGVGRTNQVVWTIRTKNMQ